MQLSFLHWVLLITNHIFFNIIFIIWNHQNFFSQSNVFITRKILQNNFGLHRTTCFHIIILGKRFACCAAKQQKAPNWCTCNAKFPTHRCILKIIRTNASLHGVLFMAWRLGKVLFRCLFCKITGFFEYKLPHLFFHDWGMLDALYDSFGNINYIIKRFWQHFGQFHAMESHKQQTGTDWANG